MDPPRLVLTEDEDRTLWVTLCLLDEVLSGLDYNDIVCIANFTELFLVLTDVTRNPFNCLSGLGARKVELVIRAYKICSVVLPGGQYKSEAKCNIH